MRLFDRYRSGDDSQPEGGARRGKHRRTAPEERADDSPAPAGDEKASGPGRSRQPYGSPPRVTRRRDKNNDRTAADGRAAEPQERTGTGRRDAPRGPAPGANARNRRTAAPPRTGRGQRGGDAAAAGTGRADTRVRPAPPGTESPARPRRQRRDSADAWAAKTGQSRDRKGAADGLGRPGVPPAERTRVDWNDFAGGGADAIPRVRPRAPGAPDQGDGRRHCGDLEAVLVRQWDAKVGPPTPEAVKAVDSLAELPQNLKDKLAEGLDGIYVGMGGVPELDDMGHLRGVGLPSGKATWDICAGAYGDRKIVVGDQASPTPDVMLHEVGHALDDIDGPAGEWNSDSDEFRALYAECAPRLVSDFHRQSGELGRREFFADAFAAIASKQRPALVDMLGGDTRTALNVMLFFNRRYGI